MAGPVRSRGRRILVLGLRRIDLSIQARMPPRQVLDALVAVLAQQADGLRAAHARLAVDDDLAARPRGWAAPTDVSASCPSGISVDPGIRQIWNSCGSRTSRM